MREEHSPQGLRQGFFYLDTYFLLPEGYENEAAFLAAARQAQAPLKIRAVILREDSGVEYESYELGVCIAPYFICDYLKDPEEMVLDLPNEVYPAEIELLTQQQYNNRLRERVLAYCPGCRRFGSLNQSDASLSGHFDEITLNGFCAYRQETRNAPRSFHAELYNMWRSWDNYNYASFDAEDMMGAITFHLRLPYSSAAMMIAPSERRLILYSDKSSLIQTALTDMLSACMSQNWSNGCTIQLNGRVDISEAAVMALLSPKKITSTRRELGRFGVKIAIIEYDPCGQDSVNLFLQTMIQENLAWVLCAEPGKVICLLTTDYAIMRLRYASPMLQPYHTAATIYDPLKTVQYQISHDMPETMREDAPVKSAKEKAPGKRMLKAEEGKVLKRAEVKLLFDYLDIHLDRNGCDNTLRFTNLWLKDTLSTERYKAALEEIHSMGGFCDCEVLLNCYEDYELN